MSASGCYHCGLPVPENCEWYLIIHGNRRALCCPGCLAVATTIIEGGLDGFYKYRSARNLQPESVKTRYGEWNLHEVQLDYVENLGEDKCRVRLTVTGITCAACSWLIEKHLAGLKGIERVQVNGVTHRAVVEWCRRDLELSDILQAVAEIGYAAAPLTDSNEDHLAEREIRSMLIRMGVAGLAMMQVGMVAVAMYAGAFQGMDEQSRQLLRQVSLVLTVPVVFYSARPFFTSAWHSLRMGHLIMDVPVALAIALAFTASVWATWQGNGEVYFDSIAMFTFFLLLGRYLEKRIRYQNLIVLNSSKGLFPPAVIRTRNNLDEMVPLKSLQAGDHIRVASGDVIPCDGFVCQGTSEVDEAVLTGEACLINKSPGSTVSAGTINGNGPLIVEVMDVGGGTRLSNILKVAESAELERPYWVGLADRLAGWFVAIVLMISTAVFVIWWQIEPNRALSITLSVLVISCPCALSLATPAAFSVANSVLRRRGLLVHKGHFIESLARVCHVVFDKTGTLTQGELILRKVRPAANNATDQLQQLAASLESGCRHPVAMAFQADTLYEVRNHKVVPGSGVIGRIAQHQYALGRPDWVARVMNVRNVPDSHNQGAGIAIAEEGHWLGEFEFDDKLRSSAAPAIENLRVSNVEVSLLTGDPSASAVQIAAQLQIEDAYFGLMPEEKLKFIKKWQRQGESLLMAGDGINDIPVLQAADVSIAMGQATDLACMKADAVLLSSDLSVIPWAIELARRTRRIVRQNVAWALAYNALALPFAAMGLVAPWAAAIGMSFSSLVVLFNALRINRLYKLSA